MFLIIFQEARTLFRNLLLASPSCWPVSLSQIQILILDDYSGFNIEVMVSVFCLHISVNTRYPKMNAVLPDKVTLYMKQEVSTKRGPAEQVGEKVAGTKSRSS